MSKPKLAARHETLRPEEPFAARFALLMCDETLDLLAELYRATRRFILDSELEQRVRAYLVAHGRLK